MKPPKDSYADFCDQFLVACAENQNSDEIEPIEVEAFCAKHFPKAAPTWVQSVTRTLVEMNLGDDWSTHDGHTFVINGHGILMADKIRHNQRPKSIIDKIRSVPRSDWIALGAFVVSLIALFKGD